nr:6924_t:CDS:2 [Entrophospora candida]
MPDYSILGIVDGENVECYLSSIGAVINKLFKKLGGKIIKPIITENKRSMYFKRFDLESLFSSKPHMEKNMEYYSHRIMLDTEEETDFNPSDFDSSDSGKDDYKVVNCNTQSQITYGVMSDSSKQLKIQFFRKLSQRTNKVEVRRRVLSKS